MTVSEPQTTTSTDSPTTDTALPPVDPQSSAGMSYREAKYLAGSRRRDGVPAYAIYNIAQGTWLVR